MINNRVVVTGIGLCTPLGQGVKRFWNSALNGEQSVAPIPENWTKHKQYTSKLWAPLPKIAFSPDHISRIESMQLDMVTMLTIEASFEALAMAGICIEQADKRHNTYTCDTLDPMRSGVITGTGVGGINSLLHNNINQVKTPLLNDLKTLGEIEHEHPQIKSALVRVKERIQGSRRFNPFIVSMIMPNAPAAYTGLKFGLKGINRTVCSACASGTMAIGQAFQEIASGRADFILTGGSEYLYEDHGGIFRGFDDSKTLVKRCDQPESANCPFDQNRSGFLFSEGGSGMLVLESLHHAQKRNASILGEIINYEESFDAYSLMSIDPSGTEINSMLERLCNNARIETNRIDYINAHGTGTELNDQIETQILDEQFPHKPYINSTKGLIGHTIGASGAIEAAVCLLSIKEGKLHPCPNLFNPVAPLNFVKKSVSAPINFAISNSFAFGGHNAALLIGKSD
ncbi:3-oxoacyl-[acyl-carrier-protein] synthase, KASII [Chitinispirillum alkaliphilum]|nr:3-oxoacyl-[acyl-carrier-protein] synthase, KASII [Chitinispirillum alkaliphilum]